MILQNKSTKEVSSSYAALVVQERQPSATISAWGESKANLWSSLFKAELSAPHQRHFGVHLVLT